MDILICYVICRLGIKRVPGLIDLSTGDPDLWNLDFLVGVTVLRFFLLFFTICICLYIICRYTYSRLYDSARYGSLFQLSISVIIISLIYFNFRLKFIAIIYFAALLYSSKLLDADYIIRKCVLFDTFLPITLLRFSPDCDKFYKITYLNTQVDYRIN